MGMLDDMFGGPFASGGIFGGNGSWSVDPSAVGSILNKNSDALASAGMQFYRNQPQMQMPAVQPLNIPVNQPRQVQMPAGSPWGMLRIYG